MYGDNADFACGSGGRIIGTTAGVEGSVSTEAASAGATAFVVASATVDGDNAAAFTCHAGRRMIGSTADVEGDVLEGAFTGATTVVNVASDNASGANDAAFWRNDWLNSWS